MGGAFPDIIVLLGKFNEKSLFCMLYKSNFVLEINNKIMHVMKKSSTVFLVAVLVLITTGLWIFSSSGSFKATDLVHFGVIVLVAGFALFFGYKRLSSERRGEPVEDELSKKVMQKAAAISYFISLYLWVFLIFLKDRVEMETEELLGTGILGMAVIFAIAWAIVNYQGIKNE